MPYEEMTKEDLIATIRDLQSRYNEALKVIDSLGGRNSNGEA